MSDPLLLQLHNCCCVAVHACACARARVRGYPIPINVSRSTSFTYLGHVIVCMRRRRRAGAAPPWCSSSKVCARQAARARTRWRTSPRPARRRSPAQQYPPTLPPEVSPATPRQAPPAAQPTVVCSVASKRHRKFAQRPRQRCEHGRLRCLRRLQSVRCGKHGREFQQHVAVRNVHDSVPEPRGQLCAERQAAGTAALSTRQCNGLSPERCGPKRPFMRPPRPLSRARGYCKCARARGMGGRTPLPCDLR